MPEKIKQILGRFGASRVKGALSSRINRESVSQRDNTRVGGNGGTVYSPSIERGVVRREEPRFDDGPMGFIPYVGDALQAAQAVSELNDGKYGSAALDAGLLLLPNIIEKPITKVVGNVAKTLRRVPVESLPELVDAIKFPYRGRNFVHHSADLNRVSDILRGESRAITPSLAVSRVDDFNDIAATPMKYGDFTFIGDKSLLDNSALFKGDAMSPTVLDVYPEAWTGKSVPPELREDVAEKLWNEAMHGEYRASGPRMTIDELSMAPMNKSDRYFEAIYHGTLPYERFKYVVAPEPGSLPVSRAPYAKAREKLTEDTIDALEKNGLKVKLYNNNYKPYEGYSDWAEKILDIVSDTDNGVLFKSGGGIHIKPSHRGRLTELKKRTGKTEAELYRTGSPAVRKMITFARNSRKWKHGDGGLLDNDTGDNTQLVLDIIQRIKAGLK